MNYSSNNQCVLVYHCQKESCAETTGGEAPKVDTMNECARAKLVWAKKKRRQANDLTINMKDDNAEESKSGKKQRGLSTRHIQRK